MPARPGWSKSVPRWAVDSDAAAAPFFSTLHNLAWPLLTTTVMSQSLRVSNTSGKTDRISQGIRLTIDPPVPISDSSLPDTHDERLQLKGLVACAGLKVCLPMV
jgi:hypothetical protein